MKSLLLFSTALLFSLKLSGQIHKPIQKETVLLKDKQTYPIYNEKINIFEGMSGRRNYAPYKWEIELNSISETNTKVNPIIFRAFEKGNYSFNHFKEFLILNFNNTSFPVYYERLGLNREYNDKTSSPLDLIKFLDFFNSIMNESKARKEIFTYFLEYYKLNESKFPKSIKTYAINILNNSLNFLKAFPSKINHYTQLDKSFGLSSGFAERIGYYNSFLYRRIMYNKIPINEITEYIKTSIETINYTISNNYYTNIKDVEINQGQIMLSDKKISGFGIVINVWSRYNKKNLEFDKFSQIKCIQENGVNYYLIEHDGSESLIDTNLNIIVTRQLQPQLFEGVLDDFEIEGEEIPNIKSTIKMIEKNGVFFIPVIVNDIPMQFILDTGASSVSISLAEAILMLKNGSLTENDIIGSTYYKDANGQISEGTKINIRKIKIGDKYLYNIEASVVHNLEAPLLIGQTALKKIGKFSIDTKNSTLHFE